MTDVNNPVWDGQQRKAAGSLSMISILAISVGMAAAPARAQDMTASPAPVQAAPVISAQPAPAAQPMMTAPVATAQPATAAEPAPTVSQTRADDLASEGGFDAATAAPEALAQIEREQQARKDAAAKSAAAQSVAAAKPAPARTTSAPVADSAMQPAPAFDADGSAALAEDSADSVAVIPMIAPVAESTAAPAATSVDGETDWSLLAVLAAMLGVGGAGAYAATRRRRNKTRQVAALNAAIMPELRRDPAEADIRPTVDAAPTEEERATAKADLAEFVASLPVFETPPARADRNVELGQRRVAAAPRPYLDETDLSRPEGYFTAHVDAMPTPQNPFLTRRNRVKRARFLEKKLAGAKASIGKRITRMAGTMHVARPLEAALH